MLKRKAIAFWVGTTILLLIGTNGCADLFSTQTIKGGETESRQTISTSYRFEDIPLPPGMVLNRKESFIYETKTTRQGFSSTKEKGRRTN
jgi:hypothetical protein